MRALRQLLGRLRTEQHGVPTVLLGELDLDRLPQRRGEVLADVVGTDGQFAVAPVDEDRELDRARAPDVVQGVEGGAEDRKSTRLNSSHLGISYAVFCLKKKKK